MLNELKNIRYERDNDKTYKKLRETAQKKFGHMRSSLGFAGADILGLTGFQTNSNGIHTKPASYQLSKQQEAQNSMNTTLYDDSGRGLKSMKIHRLLDQAKQVIAKEHRKAQKDLMKKTMGKSSIGMSGGMNTNYNSSMGKNTMGLTGAMSSQIKEEYQEDEDEELQRINQRRIGPFSFDIDDDIDTEVLTNEQVYDDLKELTDILEEGNDGAAQINLNQLGKLKRKR